MGGALTAVSPDFTRAELGVPAMNYSVLLAALGRLRRIRAALLNPSYPNEAARPLRARPDADAVGPGRARRLRRADDLRPAARHAGPPGADEHRPRRPPGHQLPVRRRGPHDRRRGAQAGPVSGTLAEHLRAVGRQTNHAAARTRARRSTTTTSARYAKARSDPGKSIGTEPPPVREHPQLRRRGPARRPAGRAGDGGEDRLRLLRRGDPRRATTAKQRPASRAASPGPRA